MKKSCIYAAFLLAMAGMACKSDPPVTAAPATSANPAESTSSEAAATPAPDIAASPSIAQPASGVVASPALTPAAPQTQAAPATASTGSGKLNPAHGQPGHRCDIAVGAPLDSKPAPKGTTAANTPIRTTTVSVPSPTSGAAPTTTVAPPTAVAPGMNPAHGQPGHRCDIAVGAPLDSKPAAKQ